jgi:hypothetical protein
MALESQYTRLLDTAAFFTVVVGLAIGIPASTHLPTLNPLTVWIVYAAWRALFFPAVGAAVSRYLEENDVEWVDWEDEPGKVTYQR